MSHSKDRKRRDRQRRQQAELARVPAPQVQPSPVATGDTATPEEVTKMVERLSETPRALLCPLCNCPITVDDAVKNMATIMLNNTPVKVHQSCPGDLNRAKIANYTRGLIFAEQEGKILPCVCGDCQNEWKEVFELPMGVEAFTHQLRALTCPACGGKKVAIPLKSKDKKE